MQKTVPFALVALGMMIGAAQGQMESPRSLGGIDAVEVRDVRREGEAVVGRIVNRSDQVLSDVRLLIRYTWFWKNERNPGKDNPGRAAFYTVPSQVEPNGELTFYHRPDPPLPERRDGHFEVAAEVVSYTGVEPAPAP